MRQLQQLRVEKISVSAAKYQHVALIQEHLREAFHQPELLQPDHHHTGRSRGFGGEGAKGDNSVQLKSC